MELVNWNGECFEKITSNHNCRSEKEYHKFIVDIATNDIRHALIKELAAAWTELYAVVKQTDLCVECFKGNLGRKQGRGCCAGCELQGPTACQAKPVGCATYHCHNLGSYANNGVSIEYKIDTLKAKVGALVNSAGYFVFGLQGERELVMTYELKEKYKRAIKLVKSITRHYQRNPVTLNQHFYDTVKNNESSMENRNVSRNLSMAAPSVSPQVV